MEMPCMACPVHQTYTHLFDIDLFGADCPERCEEYERWKAEREADHEQTDTAQSVHGRS